MTCAAAALGKHMYMINNVLCEETQITNIDSESAGNEMGHQSSSSASKKNSDQLWDPLELFCHGDPIYEDEPHQCIYILDNGERCNKINGKPRRILAIEAIKNISRRPIEQIGKHEIRMVLSQVLCLNYHNNETTKGFDAFNEVLRRCRKRVAKVVQDCENAKKAEKPQPKPKPTPRPTQDERDIRFSQDMEEIRFHHKQNLKAALSGGPMNKERRPPTVWGEYNRRWVNIHLMLRETYKPSSTRGAYAVMQHWFATKQPAYVHEALPWPVPGFDAYRVTADEARAFYKKAFVTHKYNVADEGEEGKLSAADMAYYRDVILIEKRRWWPLVEHLGGEKKLMAFADDKENVLKGVKPERVLLTVLRVLDEMGRKVEEPILKLDPDGGVYSLSKTWKEYLGCRLQ